MAFNLDDYAPVQERITAFWEKFPQGRIHTVIVSLDEKQVIVRAEVWTDREDARPVTVDHAQEKVGGSGMTANSWLEIACTSAIGRCLADLDFSKSKKGNRPSREEMLKASAQPHNWSVEAQAAHDAGDLEKLRVLYVEAEKSKAPQEDLVLIRSLADALKTK